MSKKKIVKRLRRQGPDPAEAKRLKEVRKKVKKEFPPRKPARLTPATTGIAAQIRNAREEQGLTWYAVAKRAAIPNPNTVRDIEYGRDVRLSNLEAVASALGLRLELVHGDP